MLVFKSATVNPYFEVNCPARGKHVGYAQLKFKDHIEKAREKWGQYLTGDGKYLCPFKVRERFSSLLQRIIRGRRDVSLDTKPQGPAVTIRLAREIAVDLVISLEVRGWPASANAWGNFATKRTWPTEGEVRHLKREDNCKYHLVAKPCCTKRVCCGTFWRLSFSEAEKFLLKPKAESEKKCYRVVKAIFQLHEKDLKPPLCSYHLKTLFLHRRKHYPREWTASLYGNVVAFLEDLINRLCGSRKPRLPHFFIQRIDLLGDDEAGKEFRRAGQVLRRILNGLRCSPAQFLQSLPDP